MEKKPWHTENDDLYNLHQENLDQYEDYIKDKYNYTPSGNGLEPKSRTDLGRNCPRCAGRLRIKEETENGIIIVYCKECAGEYHHLDFDTADETADKIYRTIPLNVVNYWMNYFKENRKKEQG